MTTVSRRRARPDPDAHRKRAPMRAAHPVWRITRASGSRSEELREPVQEVARRLRSLAVHDLAALGKKSVEPALGVLVDPHG